MQEAKWILSVYVSQQYGVTNRTIQDYINKIVIANDAQVLGLNNGTNAAPIPPKHEVF